MEIIELTTENIDQYLDDCVSMQALLVKSDEIVHPQLFRDTVTEPNNHLIGVVVHDILIGIGLITKIIQPVETTGYINNIVVTKAHQGNGFFSIIMQALEDKAVEWHCDKIVLTCSRALVQPLYEKRDYLAKNTKFYIKKL